MSSKLTSRDAAICERLRLAREELGITQAEVSRQIGISRDRIVNYESGRSPLRYDIALRICRQLIISEEWLATGTFKLIERAAKRQRTPVAGSKAEIVDLHPIFRRQCVDLLSEPVFHEVPPGTLFGDAFDHYLSAVYERLVNAHFYFPRIVFRDSDSTQLALNYVAVLAKRWMILLENEARRRNLNPSLAVRSFLLALTQAGWYIHSHYVGSNAKQLPPQLEWLRVIVTQPGNPIGPLFPSNVQSPAESTDTLALTV
jgi:transcriptional regulator with XRE-family HTH domain